MAANAKLDLSIQGMTCGSCVRHVTEALEGVPGVADVRVSLADGSAAVGYDPEVATKERMTAAVEAAGYRVEAVSGGDHQGLPTRNSCEASCCA